MFQITDNEEIMSKHDKCEPGRGGLSVTIRHGDVEKAMKVLKKKVLTDGLLKEIKARQAYEKPSVKRRRVKAEARRRHLKELRLRKRLEGY